MWQVILCWKFLGGKKTINKELEPREKHVQRNEDKILDKLNIALY